MKFKVDHSFCYGRKSLLLYVPLQCFRKDIPGFFIQFQKVRFRSRVDDTRKPEEGTQEKPRKKSTRSPENIAAVTYVIIIMLKVISLSFITTSTTHLVL